MSSLGNDWKAFDCVCCLDSCFWKDYGISLATDMKNICVWIHSRGSHGHHLAIMWLESKGKKDSICQLCVWMIRKITWHYIYGTQCEHCLLSVHDFLHHAFWVEQLKTVIWDRFLFSYILCIIGLSKITDCTWPSLVQMRKSLFLKK